MSNKLAVLWQARALADAIRAVKRVPSGELYAHFIGVVSLDEYLFLIELLEQANLVKVESHLITWIGGDLIGVIS
jgi:hypothetical protein